ncbi:MAG TPA: hypothetical protein PKY77_12475 [Phycisphaerae bacterium]|nr:hypothetical protein [Phycisphaerae bacterium]HRY70372.1 hypothetical protein [Phycisphaerae bacterium]HSA28089.1 hypothetical protein [Phycisphaerae bacterium]
MRPRAWRRGVFPILVAALMVTLTVGVRPAAGNPQVFCLVDDDASPGGDGRSWATAYRDLQDTLADAKAS